MATTLDLIKTSLRLLSVKAAGENLEPEEANDAFDALNRMIAGWNNQSQLIFNQTEITHTLVPGTGSYTIGPSATINTVRPQNIKQAFINDGTTDWAIEVVNSETWYDIWDKTTQSSYPQYMYYDSDFTTGTIHLWPVPSSAHTLHMVVWDQLAAFASTASTVTLPPGYEEVIVYNLAVRIAPEYGKEPSPTVSKIATDSMSWLKKINMKNIPKNRSAMRFLGTSSQGNNGFLRGLFGG